MINDPDIGRIWSEGFTDFMDKWWVCVIHVTDQSSLIRSGTDRPYPRELLQHPFIKSNETKKINMGKWVAALCDW
jgi:mitogen-activated protein kinase kinase